MELGVLTNLYASKSLDETLSILHGMGVTMAEIGCDYLQGYLFSRPLAVKEFVSMYMPGVKN